MNFELSEEQKMIQQSVERFVQENYDLTNRVKISSEDPGYSQDYWTAMAELGWLGLAFSEEDGGFGGNQIDTLVLMEQFGKGLVLEPFLANIVLGGGAIKRGGTPAIKESVLPNLIEGNLQVTLAYAEEQSRFDIEDVATAAREDGNNFIINGKKSMVLNAESADKIVVVARTNGSQVDEDGISLFLVDATSAGIERENFPTVDGLRASEITFTDVEVSSDNLIGEKDKGFSILQAVVNDAILALSAEAVGAMEVLYKDTVEYTQQREQFDHPLSDFQVLQHRMVDMFMEYEQCKSLLLRATMETVQDPILAQRTVHALKHLIGKSGIFVGESAVQLHGGMGVTEELRIGHFFKRLLVIDSQFGNSDFHLDKFTSL
ncbi:MAG: pimeloyl-CoA dehydrogenase small subunit [Gammaproteobacteria bacterium]|jgi:alkylation response protein AidB-like acyl-CoA dehydrogenase|nr:pimeloyl-CoA dehydrogenase small subunit [Gammaproteobacteria bacterium]MAS01812.1 pimeloyl-CoA dehydrogenase small subunit [Gammaproteobacteria bacterium]